MRKKIFKLGSNIGGAIVIDYEGDMQNACTAFYVVKYLCCEKELTISHYALERRVQRHSTLCHECVTRKMGKMPKANKGIKRKRLAIATNHSATSAWDALIRNRK